MDNYTSPSSSSITQMDHSEDINNHIVPHGDGDQKEDTESDLESCMEDDYDETVTSTEASDDQEDTQSLTFTWTNIQLELLESAVPSYIFFPQTTTVKMLEELQGSDCHPYTERMVEKWFSKRLSSLDIDRQDVLREKLAMCDNAGGSMPKTIRKVRFSEKVQVKIVEEEDGHGHGLDRTGHPRRESDHAYSLL